MKQDELNTLKQGDYVQYFDKKFLIEQIIDNRFIKLKCDNLSCYFDWNYVYEKINKCKGGKNNT